MRMAGIVLTAQLMTSVIGFCCAAPAAAAHNGSIMIPLGMHDMHASINVADGNGCMILFQRPPQTRCARVAIDQSPSSTATNSTIAGDHSLYSVAPVLTMTNRALLAPSSSFNVQNNEWPPSLSFSPTIVLRE